MPSLYITANLGGRLEAVGIGQIPAGFGIKVQMVVSLPGMDRAVAQAMINQAHEVCPYSNATRGNIEVSITLA